MSIFCAVLCQFCFFAGLFQIAAITTGISAFNEKPYRGNDGTGKCRTHNNPL